MKKLGTSLLVATAALAFALVVHTALAEDGDDAWTLLAQFIELDRLRRTDVDALAARLLDLDQRIEVFRSNG